MRDVRACVLSSISPSVLLFSSALAEAQEPKRRAFHDWIRERDPISADKVRRGTKWRGNLVSKQRSYVGSTLVFGSILARCSLTEGGYRLF